MATKPTTTRRRAPAGNKALDKVGSSIDAAQAALKDLRGGLSKGGKDAVKDLEATLRDARKHLRGAQRTVLKDLEEVKAAAASKRTASTSRASTAKRTTTKRTTTARKTTGTRARSTRKTS